MKLLESAWNQAFEDYATQQMGGKELKERNRIWATELGKAPIDVWLKMKATPASNPADARSMRKFEAGNIWEQIIGIILKRSGILIDAQKWTKYQYAGLLEVGGYLDYMTGGFVDWKKAKELVESPEFAWLPDRTKYATKQVIENLSVMFPSGLPKMILEIKSTSGYMYDNYLHTGASENHVLQLFHYLIAEDIPYGNIVYVDRDSVRMVEFEVDANDPAVQELYKKRIEAMTYYVKNDIRPPLENFVNFDELRGKFSTNWKVIYSEYLTMLYKHNGKAFEHGEAAREYFDPKVTQWNSLIKRMASDKKMTPKNQEWLADLKTMFTDEEIDNFVSIVRSKLDDLKEEENGVEE